MKCVFELFNVPPDSAVKCAIDRFEHPRSANIGITERSPLEEFVAEDKSIRLVDIKVFVLSEAFVELLRHHKVIIGGNVFEIGIGERLNRYLREFFDVRDSFRSHKSYRVVTQYAKALGNSDMFLLRENGFVNRYSYNDLVRCDRLAICDSVIDKESMFAVFPKLRSGIGGYLSAALRVKMAISGIVGCYGIMQLLSSP